MKRAHGQASSQFLYRVDIRVFYDLILQFLNNNKNQDINKISPADFDEIFQQFQKAAGTTKNLKKSTLVDHYYAKVKTLTGSRSNKIQQLKKWYANEGFCHWTKELISDDAVNNLSGKCIITESNIFQGKKFFLFNFLFDDTGKVLMRAVKTLIVAHGGTLLEEDDLDDEACTDTFVINFGPIQGEVSEFVETYSYDLYQPELIFVSVSEKEFAAKPSRFLAFKNGVVGNEKFHIQEELMSCKEISTQTIEIKTSLTSTGTSTEENANISEPGEGNSINAEQANQTHMQLFNARAGSMQEKSLFGKKVIYAIDCAEDRYLERILLHGFGEKATTRQLRTAVLLHQYVSRNGETDFTHLIPAVFQEMNDAFKEIYKRPSSITQDLQRFVTGKGNIAQANNIFPEIPINFWQMLENFATQKP